MGLDQYLYSVKSFKDGDEIGDDAIELGYWRKHSILQRCVEEMGYADCFTEAKGGGECVITADKALALIEWAIGWVDREAFDVADMDAGWEFMVEPFKRARREIQRGRTVVYSASC